MSHTAPTFPLYLHLGRHTIHPHLFFEVLSYLVAFGIYFRLRRRFGDPIAVPLRWAAVAAGVTGAVFGSKILFWLEDPQLSLNNLHNPAFLIGGKTIVGALAGGLVSVELMKRYIGLRQSTGDLYTIPLAVGIAVGRIGCFLTGLSDNTYGTPTNLPWAVNFGDGIPRHPTQIYEIIFLAALTPFLYLVLKKISASQSFSHSAQQGGPSPRQSVIPSEAASSRSEGAAQSRDPGFLKLSTGLARSFHPPHFLPGDAFKLFMLAYMSFRLLCDFIKPYPRIFLGLGTIQWACVLIILYYLRDILRWLRPDRSMERTASLPVGNATQSMKR